MIPPLTAIQKALLLEVEAGALIVGELGKNPSRPNHRIFSTSNGTEIPRWRTVTSLLEHGYLKVISEEGSKRYLGATELGRIAVSRAAVWSER